MTIKQCHTQIVTEREIFENVNRILSFGTSRKVKHYIILFTMGNAYNRISYQISVIRNWKLIIIHALKPNQSPYFLDFSSADPLYLF